MTITLNHTIVWARDKEGAARFFAEFFGLRFEGSGGHFAPVRVNAGARHAVTRALSFEGLVEVVPSARPELEPADPLVPQPGRGPRLALEALGQLRLLAYLEAGHLQGHLGREAVLVGDASRLQQVLGTLALGQRVAAVGFGQVVPHLEPSE